MTTHIIILSYCGLSLFIGGMISAKEWEDIDSAKEFVRFVGASLIFSVIGIPALLWDNVIPAFTQLIKTLQLKFLYYFFFTKMFTNMDKEKLSGLNHNAKYHFNKKTLHNAIYRYCVKMVNKRNNYTA
jgi:hypothetical protein